MLTEPPLVGRDEEIGRLGSILKKVISGSGGLILLSGEAGIGKTRLATEFERQAQASGCKVLVGGCLPSTQIPYLVFLDALNDLFEDVSEKKKSRSSRFASASKKATPELLKAIPLFGGVLKASAVLFSENSEGEKGKKISKEHVLFKILGMLRAESTKHPVIVHLDDLQWADSASIGMLHFLARNLREVPVLLLGTYRPEEVLLDRAGARHPFLESLRIMRRENLIIDELILKPLVEKELNRVVTEMLQKPVHEQVLSRIFKESGGSPLFAVETVRLLESIGALTMKQGKYHISGKMEDSIPSSVKEVIQRRIERTSKEERKVLDYAAVLGMNINPELLAGALRMEQLPVLEALEHLDNDHKLIHESGAGYSFIHEKVQRFTYEAISSMRRRELHRVVGTLIERQLPNEVLYPDLAFHFYSAKESDKAMRYSYEAGRFCLKNHALLEAIPNFERVLELGPKTKDFEEFKLPATEGLGDAFESGGDVASAAKLYEGMLEAQISGIQRVRVLRKLATCWMPQRLGKGGSDRALAYISMAQVMPEMDALEEGEIYSLLRVLATSESNWEEARRLGMAAEDGFRRAKNQNELIIQLVYNSSTLITTGEIEMALEKLQEADELNQALQDMDIKMEWHMHIGTVYLHMGKIEEAMQHYRDCSEIAKKLGIDSIVSIVNFYQSLSMSLIGDFDNALIFAERSREFADKIKRDFLKMGADAALAHIYYSKGKVIECDRYASEALEIFNSFDKKLKAVNIGMAMIAGAEASRLNNDWEGAQQYYHKAITVFESCVLGKLMHCFAITWYGDALRERGNNSEAINQLTAALKGFEEIGNQQQIMRCKHELDMIKR